MTPVVKEHRYNGNIKNEMTRKFHKTKCVYCLKYFEDLTSDHVFPQAWHLNGTPQNINGLQVPACDQCNQGCSKVEDEFFVQMGLCVDPHNPIFSQVAEKAVRSAKQSCARSEHDRIVRKGRLKKLMNLIIPSENIPQESIVPGFGPWVNFEADEQVGVKVAADHFNKFGEKLVRGLTYIYRHGTYIDENHKIHIYLPQNDVCNSVTCMQRSWQECIFHPTLSIKLAFTSDDEKSGLFDITIWDTLRMFGVVEPKNINQEKKFYEEDQEKTNTEV